MDDITTERSFVSQAMCVIDVLGLLLVFWTCYPWVFAEVQSTGVGIECLYCVESFLLIETSHTSGVTILTLEIAAIDSSSGLRLVTAVE